MQALLATAPSPSPRQSADKKPRNERRMPALAEGPARFIPVSRYGLRAKLVAMLAEGGADAKAWGRALDCLAAWRHQEHRRRLLDLLRHYHPFSPDSDTIHLIKLDQKARAKAQADLIAGVARMLEQANFVRLSRDDVQRLLIERSPYGLHLNVDLSEFDEGAALLPGHRHGRPQGAQPLAAVSDEGPARSPDLLAAVSVVEAKVRRGAHHRDHGGDRRHARAGGAQPAPGARAYSGRGIERPYLRQTVQAHSADRSGDAVPQYQGRVQTVRQAEADAHRRRRHGSRGNGDGHQAARRHQSLHACLRHRRPQRGGVPAGDEVLQYAQSLHDGAGAKSLFSQPRQQSWRIDLDRRQRRGGRGQGGHAALRIPCATSGQIRCAPRDQARGDGFPPAALRGVVDFDAEDALRRLLADGLIRSDADGNLTAIAPDEARAHLDTLWDRLLDIDNLDHAAVQA